MAKVDSKISCEAIGVSVHNRLGKCSICGDNDARYTCPRCEVKSCSLACVKIHKADDQCSGERDKTAFKRVSEFTNLDLLSDYRMLEETSRSVENCKRNPMIRITRHNKKLPLHMHRLQLAVTTRGSRLLFLPQHFTRHKCNTTFFNWKDQKIQWRIDWVFPQASHIKATDERVLEDCRLSSLVDKYLSPKTCPEEMKESLQFYQAVGLSGIILLLKAEGIRKSSSRFYELDTSLTLKNALKNKCVMEYPTIFVVLKNHRNIFDVIESDEEFNGSPNFEMAGNVWPTSLNHSKQLKSAPKNVNKNLLFNESDSSDGDYSENSYQSKQLSDGASVSAESSFYIPDYYELINQTDS